MNVPVGIFWILLEVLCTGPKNINEAIKCDKRKTCCEVKLEERKIPAGKFIHRRLEHRTNTHNHIHIRFLPTLNLPVIGDWEKK